MVRCSLRDPSADVFIDEANDYAVHVRGRRVATIEDPAGVFAANVACAVGVLVALDEPLDDLPVRLTGLPSAEHRQSVATGEAGFTIIDDTYNSNPVGAREALVALRRLAGNGRRVVVTPGMVELGKDQFAENRTFAEEAGRAATDVVVVGRTNRRAILEGTSRTDTSVIVMDSREEAVAWVRENLVAGDVVLYENDLPDHFP